MSTPPESVERPAIESLAATPRSAPATADDDTPTSEGFLGSGHAEAVNQMPAEPAPGSILRSRYILEDIIGRGGTSIVFRARDLHRTLPQDISANLIAIKILRSELRAEPMALTYLKNEFRQMQCLSHPGIVRVFDLDCDGGVWFISMELVFGQTVKTWTEVPVCHADALRLVSTCCQALEHAHSLGVLHGDLKPTNVMVTNDGLAKLIDFGSASSLASRAAAGSDPPFAGTSLYASPQILAGKGAEQRDDIFSLACLTYSILSGGRHPFGGRPALEDGRAKSAPTKLRAIPTGLFEIVERGLSAERERRPASVGEFLRDFTDAARRHRAEITGVTTLARDGVAATRQSGSAAYEVRSVLHEAEIAPAMFAARRDSLGGGHALYRRARLFARLIALAFAIVGAAVLFRPDTRRDVSQAAESARDTSIISPELMATARAETDLSQETNPSAFDSGVISFDSSTVRASAGQSLVAVSVKRLHATKGQGAFLWRVERGSAQPGIDYQPIEPQVTRFIEGQTTRTLFIPLINSATSSAPRGLRTFTVALKQLTGGPAVGRFARVTVAIDPPPTSNSFTVYQARAEE